MGVARFPVGLRPCPKPEIQEPTIPFPGHPPKPSSKREPKSRAARLALTGESAFKPAKGTDGRSGGDEPVRRSLSGHRSVRESALNRLGGGPKPMSSLAGRISMMALAALVLLGVSLAIITYDPGEAGDDSFRPSSSPQYNYKPVNAATDFAPGRIVGDVGEAGFQMELGDIPVPDPVAPVIGISGVTGTQESPGIEPDPNQPLKFSERLAKEIAEDGGVLHPALLDQAKQIDTFAREPMFRMAVRIREDAFPPVPPSMSVNEHLKRERYQAERAPVPGGDPQKGPFFFPPMMESPRIAFDGLLRDVAAADPSIMAAASLGRKFLHYDRPQTVEAARGYVFEASGRLWMLREQPLRQPVEFGGKTVSSAYFGIIAQLRPGLDHEMATIHDTVAFTALSLPEGLKRYAMPAAASPSNDDLLAREVVGVTVTGAWFRRIAFIEKSAELTVELPQDPNPNISPGNTTGEFLTEAYMPWLVGQTAAISAFELPDAAATRDLALLYSESNTPVKAGDKDHFDEAAYYVLLANAATGAPAFLNMPSAEITIRDLGTPNFRNQYRGARVKARGFLLDTYHPLVFPPNISGLRHGYRTFLADADSKDEVKTELTWYVDVVEPPLSFRGSPRVEVDGQYCRSQVFQTKLKEQTALLTLPILVARKVSDPGPDSARASDGVSLTHILIVGGSVLAVILAVVFLTRRERRREAKWQADVLAQAHARRKAKQEQESQ